MQGVTELINPPDCCIKASSSTGRDTGRNTESYVSRTVPLHKPCCVSSLKSGTLSVRGSRVGVLSAYNSTFPAGAGVSDGFMMDNHRLLPLGSKPVSSIFFFFSNVSAARWFLITPLHSAPFYTDGALFSCTKPEIAVSSENMMTQLSEFVLSVDVDVTRAGQERKNADSRRLDHMQGVDLFFGAETTVDFQEKPAYISPLLTIFNSTVSTVDTFSFLGNTI